MIRNVVRLRSALVAVTAAAASVGTVAVAAPAHASTPVSCTAAVSIKINSKTTNQVATYGDYLSISIETTSSCPGSSSTMPLAGNVTLYRSINGGTFTPIQSSTTGETWLYTHATASKNVRYGAVYNGGSYDNGVDVYTYPKTASASAPGVRVIRKVSHTYRSVRGGVNENFRMAPAASIRGLRVKVQIRRNGSWHTYKTPRVSSTGHAKFFVGIGKTFRVVMPTARGLTGSRTPAYRIVRL